MGRGKQLDPRRFTLIHSNPKFHLISTSTLLVHVHPNLRRIKNKTEPILTPAHDVRPTEPKRSPEHGSLMPEILLDQFPGSRIPCFDGSVG